MDYQRSPYREKDPNFQPLHTPKKELPRKYDLYSRENHYQRDPQKNLQINFQRDFPKDFPKDKENAHSSQINLNRKQDSNFKNTFLETNSKHITSQMINEYENQFNDKPGKTYQRQPAFDPDNDPHSKSTYEDKRPNAKNFEIESKLNKIQSFHQKIQTLLDIVNKKPKTPSKNDHSTHLTPNKTPTHQQTSRSMTKVSPLKLKEKFDMQIHSKDMSCKDLLGRREARQRQYAEENSTNYPNHYHKNSLDQFEEFDEINWRNERNTAKFNDEKMANRPDNEFKRQNKYFLKEKGPFLRAAEQFKESTRKKSKEYMKSIEGEVRDIQNTIELLNQKIKQVDTTSPFKKQIVFDNLSTSNPESLSDNNERVQAEVEKMQRALNSRTPNRAYKETTDQKSPGPNHLSKYNRETELKKESGFRHERSFRNASMTGAENAGSKYQLEIPSQRLDGATFKREGQKMTNPYDGDVQASEERSKYMMYK